MDSIVKLVESRIQAGTAKTSFTYLEDGENETSEISLNQVRDLAIRLSENLQTDMPVLIMLPQGLSFVSALFGCLYSGKIAVPIAIPSKNRGQNLIHKILGDTNSTLIITDRETFSKVKKWLDKTILKGVDWVFIDDLKPEENRTISILEMPKPDQPAFIQYTSGSTGTPKGVVVTHENIISNSGFIQERSGNSEYSSAVFWLPCFHDLGLIGGIFQPIFANFKCAMMSPTHFIQRPVRWFSAITKYRATISAAPNFGFEYCLSRIKDDELEGVDLSSLQSLYNGSEPIKPETLRDFVDRFSGIGFKREKIFTCYGLAESTLAVTISAVGKHKYFMLGDVESNENSVETTGRPQTEVVSVGTPASDSEVRIVDQDSLIACRENEIGEILTSGKSLAAGYYNNGDENDQVFFDFEGRRTLRTGDLGFLSDGELFVTGRIKDLIIIRGKNHYPQDIEKTVSKSHDSLQPNACAAFSVAHNSEENLTIVQEVKRSALRKTSINEAITRIRAQVSQNHGIQPYEIVLIKPGNIPKTTSGKIRRNHCRDLWQSGGFSPLQDIDMCDS